MRPRARGWVGLLRVGGLCDDGAIGYDDRKCGVGYNETLYADGSSRHECSTLILGMVLGICAFIVVLL